MRIEEQIGIRLRQGASPVQLIAEGFSKSTVYKVLESMRAAQNAPAPPPPLSVKLSTDLPRYLPGMTIQCSFAVTNSSAADLYVFQAGARPEWITPGEWISTTLRKLLPAGASMTIRINVAIPDELTLGEKDIFFGIYGQWVGPQTTSPSTQLMWTDAMSVNVQRDPIGIKVFLSHAVFEPSLISQLARTLVDNGVEVSIADGNAGEVPTNEIDRADFLIAIAADPRRLNSVLSDIAYAKSRSKTLILLRDMSLARFVLEPLASLGWVDLNFALGTGSIMAAVFGALNELVARKKQKEQSDAIGVILMGLGALVAGLAMSRGNQKGG